MHAVEPYPFNLRLAIIRAGLGFTSRVAACAAWDITPKTLGDWETTPSWVCPTSDTWRKVRGIIVDQIQQARGAGFLLAYLTDPPDDLIPHDPPGPETSSSGAGANHAT